MKNLKFINISKTKTTVLSAYVSAALIICTGTAFAGAAEDPSASAYVDSVTQWGAWELDIEPAAGGLKQPDSRPLKARNAKLDLRTNSFSALAPRAPGADTPGTGGKPTTPPFGGPSDGFF